MSSPLNAQTQRRAVDSIGGTLYQIWQSLLTWVTLAESEALYLEGAEDIDVIGSDLAEAVQVRRTADRISLGSSKIVAAIGNFWQLSQSNSGRKLAFRYLTTSQPTVERQSPFGRDVPGIDFWEDCRKHGHGIDQIKNFLLGREDLDKDLELFLKSASSGEIHEKLIRPIAWITGQRRTEDIQNTISDILIEHGDKHRVPPSAAVAARAKLLEEVCNTVAMPLVEDRALNRAKFLTIFEQATSVRIPRMELDRLQTAIVSQGQQDGQLASALPFVRGPAASEAAPPPPNNIFRRTELIQTVSSKLQSVDILFLLGSTGIGKSTLAACVAQTWGKIFWVSLRGNTPESVGVGLRRLAGAISADQGQSLIVLDDIDLTPAAARDFESEFASLLIVAREKASPVLLTAQRDSQQISRRFSDYAQSSIQIPPMSFDEIRAYCVQQGCTESDSVVTALDVQGKTTGHPILVHALIISLSRNRWTQESDSLTANLEALDDERTEARQLLLSLTENNRELLYRLTLIEDQFRRDHALKIGELEPPVSFAGDAFDLVVGPWIEPLAGNYFRVSALLQSEAERVWSADKCRKLHEGIAESILSCEPRTTIEANTALRNAWQARSARHLYGIWKSLIDAPSDIARSAYESMVWFAANALSSGVILFEEDHRLSGLLRSLQYRIAQQAHEFLAEAVLTAWLAETELREVVWTEKVDLSMHMTIFSSAPVAPRAILWGLGIIEEIKATKPEMVQELESRAELASLGEQKWATIDLFGNAALIAFSRYKEIQQFEDLIQALQATPDSFRSRILAALAKSAASCTLLFDRVWLNESEKTSPDWQRCLSVFEQSLTNFASWNQPTLVDSAIRAIVVIRDEYLGQSEDALKILEYFAANYNRDSGLLRTARITILTNLHRSGEAIQVARNSVAQWEAEFESEQIHDFLALRLAAIEAAKLSEWTTALELFNHAYSFSSRKLGQEALTLGLKADAAFACWKSDQAAECVRRFSSVLREVETFASEELNKSHGFRLRKFIGGCLIWIQRQLENKPDDSVSEPPPGICSKLEEVKKLDDLPNTDSDMLWWMLTQIDYYLGTNINIELVEQRLLESSFPPVRTMFLRQKIQRALFSGSLGMLPELLAKYVDVSRKVHSELSENPKMRSLPSIDFSGVMLSDDALVGLPLFAVALLRISESNEAILSAFSHWRGFCATDSMFQRLISWMERAERQLTLDPATSLRVIYSSGNF